MPHPDQHSRTAVLPLPKPYFLRQLRIEKRRAERSKAPLSIALLNFEKQATGAPSHFERFIAPLQGHLRETDIIGYVDHGVIGILFPETGKEGAEQCISKILNGYTEPPFSIVTATYPDQIFTSLQKDKEESEEVSPLFIGDSTESLRFGMLLKRGFDFAGALLALVLLSPIMLITALVIRLSSPGPALFKQTRVGQRGALFSIYKFRSMYLNTEEGIHREYITRFIKGRQEESNQGTTEQPLYKLTSDPRITWIGRIIRKPSIDELPQLFNVLKGDMSLVGPRPPLPYEVEQYQSWHLRRILEMKPGMTGLWQVEGRSETSFDNMVRLDLRYVRTWSLLFDVKILIRTVKVVLLSVGGY
jgi:exopolysaccharide biosynthesis polyprenyl glycosylphosphotransferase